MTIAIGHRNDNFEGLADNPFNHRGDRRDVIFLQPIAGKCIGRLNRQAGVCERFGLGCLDPGFKGRPTELHL